MKKSFRTTVLRGFSALVLGCMLGAPVAGSAASPAQIETQVPGYYRMKLGDLEVTALYDGYVMLEKSVLKGVTEKDIQTLLARMFIDSTKGMQTAVNAYLINTGTNLVLVDTGAAKCFGPTMGVIGDNLRAAGYEVEQVDTVLLTHLHGDHACGLTAADGSKAFPNAKVYAAKADADFWLSEAVAAKMPKEAQQFFQMSRDAVAPYVASDSFVAYEAIDKSLLPNLSVIPLVGHTPGHTGYLFSSKGENLLVWGDIVHNYAVQLPRPEVAFEFDVDSKQAVATRKKILAKAADDKLWVAGAHLPFPGLGHVRSEGKGKGFSWVPVEYAPVR